MGNQRWFQILLLVVGLSVYFGLVYITTTNEVDSGLVPMGNIRTYSIRRTPIQGPPRHIKAHLGNHGSRNDTHILLFSAPQKCAGRTIFELVEYVSNQTHSSVHRDSIMNLQSLTYPGVNTSSIVPAVVRGRIRSSRPLAFFYTHFSFVDFENEPVKPIYFSIVRDPFERQRSFYYFKRYGDTMVMTKDAKNWRQRIDSLNLSKTSYDECVHEGREECVGERNQFEMMRHFCGYSKRCYGNPREVLQLAKRNIENHYAVVGLTDEFEDFLATLEVLFPNHFKSAVSFYKSDTFTRIMSTTKTKLKLPSLNKTRKIMTLKLKYEYELYEFIKQRFHALRDRIMHTS